MAKKNKLKDMSTDDLRDYWLELAQEYQDMIKDLKAKKRELDMAIQETHKLMHDLRGYIQEIENK